MPSAMRPSASFVTRRSRLGPAPLAALRLALVALALILVSPRPVAAEGPNLLQNPGFERPYVAMPDKENCRIAAPWVPYYHEGSEGERAEGYLVAPEYKAAFRDDFPGNRVRSGELSQQYFHSFGNFRGGVLQQVSGIPVGAPLRFEVWGMTWSCDNESKGNCDNATSGDPSPMHFRLGIDPTGNTDMWADTIVWGPENNAYDEWTLLSVEAIAKNSTVTVFVYAYPEYRSQDNNVYIDDASLTIVAPPPTNTPEPTNTLPPTDTPPPTNTPTETPEATPTTPPTATLTPTNTLPPTATVTPSVTPEPTAMPTLEPTAAPSATVTTAPAEPTAVVLPTLEPTAEPSAESSSGSGLCAGGGLLGVLAPLAVVWLVRKRS